MQAFDPARALLDLVEADRLERCEAISRQAAQSARALLADARAISRARVREAMSAERRRLRDRLAALEAASATETRLHGQRHFRALLDDAWRRLALALEARWREPGARCEWTRHVLACARQEFAAGNWSVSHAPGWPEDERQAAFEEMDAAGCNIVAAAQDDRMRAGLQVRRNGNVVDGSLHGLLADRNSVSARLLEEFSRSAA